MISFVTQNPFLRLVLPLLLGICLSLHFPILVQISPFSVIITVVMGFGLIVFLKQVTYFKNRWLFGFGVYFVFLVLGFVITGVTQKDAFLEDKKTDAVFHLLGVIEQPPEVRTGSVQCFLRIDRVLHHPEFRWKDKKILLYIKKGNASVSLRAGDVLLFNTRLSAFKPTGNPNEFDYGQYLRTQGIEAYGYADDQAWRFLKHDGLNALWNWSFRLRDKLIRLFETIGMKGEELAVASALTIGDKTNLDPEIKQAYISSGAMHILAVSGMHVALLYWVLNLLFSFLNHLQWGKYLRLG